MAAKIGSAEHSTDERVGAGRPVPEQDGASAAAPPAPHLYIVHSAESPEDPPPMPRPPTSEPRHRKSRGMIDRSVQGQIGRMLRDAFSDVSEEPVPQRFVRLLEALEAKEKQP